MELKPGVKIHFPGSLDFMEVKDVVLDIEEYRVDTSPDADKRLHSEIRTVPKVQLIVKSKPRYLGDSIFVRDETELKPEQLEGAQPYNPNMVFNLRGICDA